MDEPIYVDTVTCGICGAEAITTVYPDHMDIDFGSHDLARHQHGSYGDAVLAVVNKSWTLPEASSRRPFAGANDPDIEIRIDGTQDA